MILLLFQNICVKSSNSSYTWPDLPLKAKEISEHQMEPNISVFQGAKCTSISPKPSEWPPTLYVHFAVCSWLHQIQQMQAGNYMGKNCSRMNTNTMVNKEKKVISLWKNTFHVFGSTFLNSTHCSVNRDRVCLEHINCISVEPFSWN